MLFRKNALPYFLLFSIFSALSAPPPPIDDPGRAGILQKEIERQLPQTNPLPVPQAKSEKIKPQEKPSTQVQVTVKGFRFEGVTRVSEAELQELLQPWINKTLTLDELNKASDAVTQYYQSKNMLAQAFIPPQKIEADGIVLMKIVEAKLGAVRVEEEGKSRMDKERVASFITFQNPIGEYVDTRNIEHAIYVLNEMPGITSATELAPGDKDGEVALKVKVADTGWVKGSATLSNYGSSSTGRGQALGNLSLNNPLGLGDQIMLNGFKTEGTDYTQAGYSLPVHESGLRVGVTGSSMNYRTIGMSKGSLGYALTVGINASYPLLRSQTTNANLTVNYDAKKYQNRLDTGIINSEYSIDLLTLGFSGNHYDGFYGGGVSTLSFSVGLGRFKNPLWDSQSTSNYGQYTTPGFSKYNLNFTRNQQIVPDSMILNVAISGQLAGDGLDSVERFYLGGPNGIRAYPQSQGSGDHGAMINIELQQQLPHGFVGYAFFDAGWVQQYKSNYVFSQVGASNFKAANQYTLAGYGFGLKYNKDNFTVNGFVGLPLGENPLFRYGGTSVGYVRQNSDGLSGGSPYFWIQGIYRF